MDLEEYKKVMEIQENERHRIAYDIHDGLGQTLTAANMFARAIDETQFSDDKQRENWDKCKGYLDRSIKEARLISHNLSPQSIKNCQRTYILGNPYRRR